MATGLRRIVAEQLGDAATQLRSRTDETRDDAIHDSQGSEEGPGRSAADARRPAGRRAKGGERGLPRRGAPALGPARRQRPAADAR